jgi:hypothetical protein
MSSPARAAARPLVAVLRAYQRWISPGLPPRCRFYPTCSVYAVEALQVHGVLWGGVLATWRLLRCAPWHPGGVDPVPPRRAPGRRPSPDGSRTGGPRTRPAGNDEEQAPC